MKTLFRVPMRVHHGLLLVTYLAANHEAGFPISLDEIAEREKISQGFLEEIAIALRQGGIIEGKRGPGGGYVLCHAPTEITVAKIIEAIEGPVTLVDCLVEDAACPSEDGCSNRRIWKTVQERINETLDGIKLSELVSSKYTTTRV
jgi:Rrf2 family cysteine metabolism transcriptional repressor